MTTQNFTVLSYDGLELVCRTRYPPSNTPTRARVLFLHGFGEFLDAYNDWWPRVVKDGYEVTSYDQRGHGNTAKSPSDFGVSSEEGVMGDLEAMVDFMLKRTVEAAPPRLPLILWGFSMGGANTLAYMLYGKQKDLIDLYVAGAPYLETHPTTKKGMNGWKLASIPLALWIYPSFAEVASLPSEKLTNDPAKWALYPTEPLRHSRATVRFMYDAIKRGRRLQDPTALKQIVNKPLLLIQPGEDEVCDNRVSTQFIDNVKTEQLVTDATRDIQEGVPHGICDCLEKDKAEHWRRVGGWLDAHVAAIRT